MRLHQYRSYRQYRRRQEKKNRRQIDRVWATEREMTAVAEAVKARIPGARFGLCHGAKAGWEVRQLREQLEIEVLGTDISDTAAGHEHMIRWDFHETKPEWIGAVDFIYSNCLDHSYDPDLCIRRWLSCLRPGGLAFVEWSALHGPEHSTEDDPFGATEEEYEALLSRHGVVLDRLHVPGEDGHRYPLDRRIFVVGRTL
ncbi:MAG: class I SAM-dependent methyltransferase [Deltaproteobacteria bacterium]|nr:class I SAM-dependent methyltransferase [Deltaproteobacteria bacterium]